MCGTMKEIKKQENIFEKIIQRKTENILKKETDKTMINVKNKKEKKFRERYLWKYYL